MPGWVTKREDANNTIKKVKKYLKYKLIFFSLAKIKAIIIIKKGLNNSIGWNLGRKNISIHLLEPLTSIPMIGTKINENKVIIKSKIEILYK